MKSMRLMLRIVAIAVLLGPALAGAEDPQIMSAQLALDDRKALIIKVVFSQAITASNCGPGECVIADATRFIMVVKSALDRSHPFVLSLTPEIPLDPKGQYAVIVKNLQLAPEKDAEGRLVLKPRFPGPLVSPQVLTTAPSRTETANAWSSCFKMPLNEKGVVAGKGRDDSTFYFSGQTTHSRGKSFVGSYDFKADLSTRQGLPGPCGLFADLKGGNDPNGDPDSLKFGLNSSFPVNIWDHSPVFNQLRWSFAPTLESTEDFTNRNFIFASDLILLLKDFQATEKKTPQLYFRPRAGVEAGANLKSVVPGADGNSIARFKLGAGLMFIFPTGEVLQDITLETQYDRRWPLRSEVNQSENNGAFSAVSINTKPRDYVKQTLTLNPTKYIGFSVAYEYGSLPPIFKLVDSKFTIGLSVKAAFK